MRIAIVGPPNAGKSSLLNLLAGHEAAIVSPVAGTTRDVVQVPLELGGVKVHPGRDRGCAAGAACGGAMPLLRGGRLPAPTHRAPALPPQPEGSMHECNTNYLALPVCGCRSF